MTLDGFHAPDLQGLIGKSDQYEGKNVVEFFSLSTLQQISASIKLNLQVLLFK